MPTKILGLDQIRDRSIDATKIVLGTITNAEISASAAIDLSKLANGVRGDMLYANASGVWTPLSGNIETSVKVLAQVGDGVNALAPYWTTPPSVSNLAYYFYKTASDIGGYYKMLSTPSTGGAQNIDNASVVNGQLLASFVTEPGVPGLTFMQSGLDIFHIHAQQTGGTKTTRLYANIYKRASGGTETLINTITTSDVLTGTMSNFLDNAVIPPPGIPLLATDRLVIKFYADVSGGGSAPDVRLQIEDVTYSGVQFPSTTVDASTFVPYTGATRNVNLGTWDLSAANLSLGLLSVSSAGTTSVDTSLYRTVNVTSATTAVTLDLQNMTAGRRITVTDQAGNAPTGQITIIDSSHPSAKFYGFYNQSASTSFVIMSTRGSVTFEFDGTDYWLVSQANSQIIVQGINGDIGAGPNAAIVLQNPFGAAPSPAMHWRTTPSLNAPGDSTARMQANESIDATHLGGVGIFTRDAGLGAVPAHFAIDVTYKYTHVEGGLAFSTFDADARPNPLGTIKWNDGISTFFFETAKPEDANLHAKNLTLSGATVTSEVPDGASAVGLSIVTPAYSTTGAKLFQVNNATDEMFAINKDGYITRGYFDVKSPLYGIRVAADGSASPYNTTFGYYSGDAWVTGNYNAVFGPYTAYLANGGNYNTLMGYATAISLTGSSNTILGASSGSSMAAANGNTAVGASINVPPAGTSNVLVGVGISGSYGGSEEDSVIVGAYAGNVTASPTHSVILGAYASAAASSIAIGRGAAASVNNSMVIGGPSDQITDVYIGNGYSYGTPLGFTLNPTKASGFNTAGVDLNIAAGRGTGNAAPGRIVLRTASSTVSGSTSHSLQDSLILSNQTITTSFGYFESAAVDGGSAYYLNTQNAFTTGYLLLVGNQGAARFFVDPAGNGLFNGYGAFGTVSAPSNTTAGDLNAIRAYVGSNAALLSGLTAQVAGHLGVSAQNALRFYDGDNSNYIGLRANATRSTDIVYNLPATDPTAGQVLVSSAPSAGVATLTWTSPTALSGTDINPTASTIALRDGSGGSGFSTIWGSTSASGTLTLKSTTHATLGKILFGTSAYDELNNRLGIANASPSYPLDVTGQARITTQLGVGTTPNSSYDLNLNLGKYLSAVANGASAIGHRFDTASFTTAGAKLASFQNNSVEKAGISKDGELGLSGNSFVAGSDITSGGVYRSTVADGASSIGHIFNTANSFATTGAKIASFKNAGTEVTYIDKGGNVVVPEGGFQSTVVSSGANNFSAVNQSSALGHFAVYVDHQGANGTAVFAQSAFRAFSADTTGGKGYYGTTAAYPTGGYGVYIATRDDYGFPAYFQKTTGSATTTSTHAVQIHWQKNDNASTINGDLLRLSESGAGTSTINGKVIRWNDGADKFVLDRSANLLTAGYARVGSTTAPTNVTAGDLTSLRALIGADSAIGSGMTLDVNGLARVRSQLGIGALADASYDLNMANGTHLSQVVDGPTAIGFSYRTQALANGSAKMVSWLNDSTEKAWMNKDGTLFVNGGLISGTTIQIYNGAPVYWSTYGGALTTDVADSGAAVALTTNNLQALSTSGAKLLSMKNNGTEKLSIAYDGSIEIPQSAANTGLTLIGTANSFRGLFFNTSNAQLTVGTVSNHPLSFYVNNAQVGAFNTSGQLRIENGQELSAVADGASAIGFKLATLNSFTTSGAKLLSLFNSGTEKWVVNKDGTWTLGDLNLFDVSAIRQALCRDADTNTAFGSRAMNVTPSGVSNSVFGFGAGNPLSTGNYNTLIGYYCGVQMQSGEYNTGVGYQALYSIANPGVGSGAGANNAAFGVNAGFNTTTGYHNVYFGTSAGYDNVSGYRNVYVGTTAGTGLTGTGNIMFGYNVGAASSQAYNYSIGIGYEARVTASNQLVLGGSLGNGITDAYLGSGVTNTSPAGITLNATGGSGTNVGGADLTIAGGKGTGSGTPGRILFVTANAIGSGTTLQSLANRMAINGSGVGINTTTPSAVFEVYGTQITMNRTNISATKESNPGAPTVATGAAGVLTGAYKYKVTFVTPNGGETAAGTASATVNPVAQQVSLTAIPTGSTAVTQRYLYRTAAGGSVYYFLAAIADNSTTTYTDNIADGSLGTTISPAMNTTAGLVQVGNQQVIIADSDAGNTVVGYQCGNGFRDQAGQTGVGFQAGYFSNGANSTYIGYQAGIGVNTAPLTAQPYLGIFVGYRSGYSLTTGGTRSVYITANSTGTTTGAQNVVVGVEADGGASDSYVIALGYNVKTTASQQLVLGGQIAGVTDGYIGNGVTNTAPNNFTLNVTGGSGTNVAGGVFNIAGGKATGNAAGGAINFQTSDAGASGTTLQSLTTKVSIAASGALSGTSSIKSTSASAGVGYGTGAGGTVTQITSKATAVTINKICGQITTHNANLNDATTVSFTVNNTAIADTDTVICTMKSGGTGGGYLIWADSITNATSFNINIRNVSGGTLGEALVINYAIFKAVTS